MASVDLLQAIDDATKAIEYLEGNMPSGAIARIRMIHQRLAECSEKLYKLKYTEPPTIVCDYCGELATVAICGSHECQ